MTRRRVGSMLLGLLTFVLPVCRDEAQATKAGKHAAGPASITMPEAYSDMAYNTTIDPGESAMKQPATCVPIPALPTWLKLDCSTSTFKFSGTAPSVAKDQVISFALTVIDANNKQYAYKPSLTLRPAVETVPLKPAPAAPAAAAVAGAVPAVPDYSTLDILQTAPIQEGAQQLSGQLLNVPANAILHLQVWSQQEGQPGSLSQMQLINPAAPPATVSQVDLKSNAYTIQFPQPLAAGQTVALIAVGNDGRPVKTLVTRSLPNAIVVGDLALTLEGPLTVGSKTVSGTVSPLPNPVIKPTAASGATPATYGNLPGIIVWSMDPGSGVWSQAMPAISASPTTFLSVNADGTFQVALPTALVAGQKVRVQVVPPPQRSFLANNGGGLPPAAGLTKLEEVLTEVPLAVPTISSTPFNEGITVISGTASPASNGVTPSVAILRLANIPSGKPSGVKDCLTVDDLDRFKTDGELLPLTSSSSNTLLGAVDATAGTYKVTLADALKEGDWIQVVQVLPAGSELPKPLRDRCVSTPKRVQYPFDFHRTNLTFVAGVLLGNSSASSATNANFSQANQFYSFEAEHAWKLPGFECARGLIVGSSSGDGGPAPCPAGKRNTRGWHADHAPGFSTSFQARLTSIPVSTAASTVTSTTATASTSSPTLLTSQKVFRVETTAYLPWVVTHGRGDHPNGLFFAPLARAGFDTIAGAATATNVILPGGQTGTLNFQPAYNFYVYGARLGNMSLSASPDRAPLIEHYLDITFGRFSNLQSYVCKPVVTSSISSTTTAQPSAGCAAQYPTLASSGSTLIDSRKQLYRLDFEGLVKIPVPETLIPFYIGFNANISQHSWQAQNLDHAYAPPDDIRILFGTKIDIGTVLSSFKLGAN